jgi:hypothetical protein
MMIIIFFGPTEFLKFRFGCGPRACRGGRTVGCMEIPGLTVGGADSAGKAGCVSGFVQHFFRWQS